MTSISQTLPVINSVNSTLQTIHLHSIFHFSAEEVKKSQKREKKTSDFLFEQLHSWTMLMTRLMNEKKKKKQISWVEIENYALNFQISSLWLWGVQSQWIKRRRTLFVPLWDASRWKDGTAFLTTKSDTLKRDKHFQLQRQIRSKKS